MHESHTGERAVFRQHVPEARRFPAQAPDRIPLMTRRATTNAPQIRALYGVVGERREPPTMELAPGKGEGPVQPYIGSSATQTTAQTDGLPPDVIIGTPSQDIKEWDGQQTAADDCDVRAQQFIIEQYTGQKLSEQALEQEAESHGWYDPGHGGTPLADMSKLLEAHGIAATTSSHATVQQLADQLEEGHKVIVAVNGEDLWQHDPAFQGEVQAPTSQTADHAVVVSGIDTSDPNNPRVLISDPGTGEALASYSLQDFMRAWDTSGDTMVATDHPEQASAGPHGATTPTTNHASDPTTSDPAHATPAHSTDTSTPAAPADPTTPTTDVPPFPETPGFPCDPYDTMPAWWDVSPEAPMLVDPYGSPLLVESPYAQLEYMEAEMAILEEYRGAIPAPESYSGGDWSYQ